MGRRSVSTGLPLVMVPVLSRAIISTFPAASKEAAVLNKSPFFAPTPFPTIMATGVASPKAQGQLITNTATALERASENVPPLKRITTKVSMAIPITAGTKTPEIWSAILAIGALVAAASDTI